ncbi:MAG: hypothetical protein WDO19_21105 [Bacteroidota bacterium]
MKPNVLVSLLLVVVIFSSCVKEWDYYWDHGNGPAPGENASTFAEISSTAIGGEGAAEITAYDPGTQRLFIVTNTGTTQIDILDLSDPSAPLSIGHIDISPFGGGVNSVSVSEGKLAAAVEGYVKTDPGKVVVFKTSDYSVIKQIPVGALPDMITFSHDGKYILTANEGEPNTDYSIDPAGTVSIIEIKKNYAVSTLDFSGFAGQQTALKAKGLRVFGPRRQFCAGYGTGIPDHFARLKNRMGHSPGK